MLLRRGHNGLSRQTIRVEQELMKQDDSHTTSKEDPSRQTTLSVEEWWADLMKPSRRRRKPLTQSQRDSLARGYRQLRAERLVATQDASQ
ncbi:hypothetical protein W911_14350 [Hyphomicrobium nitrativorans NL23]|uniref:Uncharacterized protein n=1 Tax=Hyphomicrobium nitrativorans NL23 TaxID=1029756 RepID=V5SIL9_9HYPH|nr:hypothetical protein W911_14350 [Hyphomicrobium nitrativorans NL23]